MVTVGGDGRISGLRRVKLRALVEGHWLFGGDGAVGGRVAGRVADRFAGGGADGGRLEDGTIPGGATLQEVGGDSGWVLIDDGGVVGFGAALAWARRRSVRDLHVLVEDGPPATGDGGRRASGVIARRAGLFAVAPTVWRVEERSLQAAMAAPAVIDEAPVDLPIGVLDALSGEIAAHGAVPVMEHGVLRGEVLGLEVVRAVPDPDGGWRLSVGVGRHDREARAEMRAGEPAGEALDDVVALVRRWRTAAGRRHPTNTLARERLLRAAVIARPELAGAAALAPLPGPLPPDSGRTSPAVGALGLDPAGAPLVVVCSTGVDVDLVPTAADIRLLHAPEASLVLILPAADAYPLTHDLAAALRHPADVRTVGIGWSQLVG